MNNQYTQTSSPNSAVPSYGQAQCDGPVPTKKQNARIPEAHERIEKTINSLHGLIATLEERLQPALRIEPSNTECDKPCPRPVPTTIYDKINQNCDDVQHACNRVQELLRLLEI